MGEVEVLLGGFRNKGSREKASPFSFLITATSTSWPNDTWSVIESTCTAEGQKALESDRRVDHPSAFAERNRGCDKLP
jgi:hypothetical protein